MRHSSNWLLLLLSLLLLTACTRADSTSAESATAPSASATPSPLATATQPGTGSSCPAPITASAEEFVRTFMTFAERGDEGALSACLAESARGTISAAAWASTRGPERIETTPDEPWAGAHEVVRVQAWLRDGRPVSWAAGETRWFQAHATANGWRLESITLAHPRPSEDEIWGIVARQLPANTLVLRPGWLPDDFDPRLAYLWGVMSIPGTPSYWLGYESRSSRRVIHFHLGGGNSAPPTSSERIRFRDAEATLNTTASWPGIEITWSEEGYFYQIQMSAGTREELLRIARDLIAQRSR